MKLKDVEHIIDDYFKNADPDEVIGRFEKSGVEFETTAGWIDVNEKLPNSDTFILVCLLGKFLKASYFFKNSDGSNNFSTDYDVWDCIYTDYVTHWMPLPEPPNSK